MDKLEELIEVLNELIKRHNYILNTNLRLQPEETELINRINDISNYIKIQLNSLRPHIRTEVEELKIELADNALKQVELTDKLEEERKKYLFHNADEHELRMQHRELDKQFSDIVDKLRSLEGGERKEQAK